MVLIKILCIEENKIQKHFKETTTMFSIDKNVA